jgi:hypothetical protein
VPALFFLLKRRFAPEYAFIRQTAIARLLKRDNTRQPAKAVLQTELKISSSWLMKTGRIKSRAYTSARIIFINRTRWTISSPDRE